MTQSKYGFFDSQITSPNLTAHVGVWHETPTRGGGFGLNAASYALAYAGGGSEGLLWATGYANNPVPMIASAIQRLLKVIPTEIKLNVYALGNLNDHIGPNGHIRKAMKRGGKTTSGKDYQAYEPLRDIAIALDAGRWQLFSVSPNDVAKQYAGKEARLVAVKHKTENNWSPLTHPPFAIVSEGEMR